MYVSLGAAAPVEIPCWAAGGPAPCKITTASAVRGLLPECYSEELDACLDEFLAARHENRPADFSAECAPYYPVWRDATSEAWNQALDSMDYCPAPKPSISAPVAAGIAIVSLVAGVGIGMLFRRR